jgi:catechol 2,3-dioxygenase-like lactoylglutathione lyase family enzyme
MPQVCVLSLYVSDLSAAEVFYSQVLGFRIKEKHPPYIVVLDHQGLEVVLCQAEAPAKMDYPKASGAVPGIATDDLKKSVAMLQSKKVELLHTQPQEFPGGTYVAFRDPAGNVLEMLEFRR